MKTIYCDSVEKIIREQFATEETTQDKEYFLNDMNKVLSELWKTIL